jgi:glycosyltransferase involved in cell wall biosynthesis
MSVPVNKASNPKVLHVASGDLWAGAESQLFTLVTTLHNSLEVTVFVLLLNHGTLEDRLRNAGIEVIILDESSLNSFQILSKLVSIIRRKRPDVIHTHRTKENILGSVAGFIAGGIPSLRTAHGAPEHQTSWRQLRKRGTRTLDWISGSFLQRKIICVSDDLAVLLQNEFSHEKIEVIENGIDLDSLCGNNIQLVSSQETGDRTLRIGLAGRLVPVKRVDIFIKTARYIRDHHPDLKASFHIYGDGPLLAELKSLSHDQDTDSIIHFEGHRDDISQELKKLDLLMMTSDHEGLPMILLEAMALEVPIIAHATGGIPLLLDNGSCGALVVEHTPEAYAHEVHRLALSRLVRSELTANALERVRNHYSAVINARKYLSKYNEIRM